GAYRCTKRKNSTWKKNMEDVTVFHEGYGGKEGTSFFRVFDGFHGQISAVTAAREMLVLVLEQLSKQDPLLSLEKDQVKLLSRFEALFQEYYKTLRTKQLENLTKVEQVNLAFTTAFWKMDWVLGLGKDETSKIRWSGCTELLCLIDSGLPSSDEKEQGTGQESNIPTPSQELQGGRILIADCGKVHAVLYKQGSGFRLTKERKHILWSGGTISINKQHGLVEGLIKATRVLSHYGDRKLKSVIPVPYSVSLPTDPSYQLLVLASSGLWEVLDDHAVAERAVIELTQQKLILKTVFSQDQGHLLLILKNLPVSRMRTTHQSWTCQRLWEVARDMQMQRKRRDINPQSCSRSEVNVKETMADSLKNLTLNYECLAADICRELVDTLLVSGSKENISVMVILIQGLDKDYQSVSTTSGYLRQ
uniref:PPM-type phosphatase domain-containing protein n=1 Tax=Oncorhynchus tshawytscha TaxID=74940 RepID=A0A8C8D9J2_ONCTS